MKARLSAGAEIDMLTKAELNESLSQLTKSWRQELSRGVRFRRRSVAGVVAADGSLLLTDTGPAEGMVWMINALVVGQGTIPTAGLNVYANEAAPSTILYRGLTTNATPGEYGCVLISGETLVISGAAMTPGEAVTVVLAIKETPQMMAWQA